MCCGLKWWAWDGGREESHMCLQLETVQAQKDGTQVTENFTQEYVS